MSNVEFQAGIESVSPKKDSIELKLVLANISATDSALIAWLNEAIRTGQLHTVSITVDASEDSEGQLRLFEDFITEHMPMQARELVQEVSRQLKRRGHRQGNADGHVDLGGGGSIAVIDEPENDTEDLDTPD